MINRFHCPRENNSFDSGKCFLPEPAHGSFVSFSSHEPSIELHPDCRKIDFWIDADPVGFALRAGNKSI
jgi:hypothetical protein